MDRYQLDMTRHRKRESPHSRRPGTPGDIRLTGNPWLFRPGGVFTPEGIFMCTISLPRMLEAQGMPLNTRIKAVETLRRHESVEAKLRFVMRFPACVAYLSWLSQLDLEAFKHEFTTACDDYNNRDPGEQK